MAPNRGVALEAMLELSSPLGGSLEIISVIATAAMGSDVFVGGIYE